MLISQLIVKDMCCIVMWNIPCYWEEINSLSLSRLTRQMLFIFQSWFMWLDLDFHQTVKHRIMIHMKMCTYLIMTTALTIHSIPRPPIPSSAFCLLVAPYQMIDNYLSSTDSIICQAALSTCQASCLTDSWPCLTRAWWCLANAWVHGW